MIQFVNPEVDKAYEAEKDCDIIGCGFNGRLSEVTPDIARRLIDVKDPNIRQKAPPASNKEPSRKGQKTPPEAEETEL